MKKITDKKIENILFYSASRINPPRAGLENVLDSINIKDVTNVDNMRYNYSMGPKLALPLGIVILAIAAILLVGNVNKAITPQNVDASLKQADESVSGSIDQMDSDFNSLDQVSPEGDENSL